MLENAFDKSVKRRVNEVWQASFSLPADDPKNELCNHFNYIDITGDTGRYYGLYRIMPTETVKDEDGDVITYNCEHVLSVLMDDIMDPPETNGYVQFEGQTTRTVLEGLLSFQETERIVLGQCDFSRRFDYAYENENGILNAIFDVPARFGEPYEFQLDTTSFPWVLHLIKPSNEPKAEIRWGKDMISFDKVSDPTQITNYLVMKGWGEGVNQLSIADANNGVRHLKDQESINKWGKRSYIKVDRRFKSPASLKAYGERLLNEWKYPKISFECESTDLSVLPEYSHEQKMLNGVTRIIVEDQEYMARIIGDDTNLDNEHEVSYEIGNRITDIIDAQADMDRDIEVEKGYTNGSANYLSTSETDNADPTHPVKFRIWIPPEVVHVNFMELTYETDYFRGYNQAIKGGGAIVKSTKGGGGTTRSTTSGGATTATSSSGGGTSKSTNSGGGSTQTSDSKGDHRHVFATKTSLQGPPDLNMYEAADGTLIQLYASSDVIRTAGSSGPHSHSVSIPSHSHSFTVPNHTHSVSIPSHSHDVTIPEHTHEIELPNHTHEIQFGIYEHNKLPSSLEIKVDGNVIPQSGLSGENIVLDPYLAKDENGKIQRGRHAVIEVRPTDELARINATMVWGLFISSLKGVTM
ncbi:phage tail spike protein [Virgibacillus sp. Bac332]|uniref:phage tail spike protein n=1 Tax=Virgibacillus sp. Bac332 TaxID=2419842 RepID=UPI000EF54A8F|nr:phage tail spike protein [Virgibacillus sp. Bac332]